MSDRHVSIEARVSTDDPWVHRKSIPAWVLDDRESLAIQRAHVRVLVRDDEGRDARVALRIVDDNGKVVA